jgi:hypothetical protein
MSESANVFDTPGALVQLEDIPPGAYAMWWATDDHPSFGESVAAKSIGRVYRALDGIETYVLVDLLRLIDAIETDSTRMAYPEEPLQIFVEGPEQQPLVLTISQEKGIRFHFNMNITPIAYRDEFLRQFAEYAESWKRRIEAAQRPKDQDWEPRALGWWELAEKVSIEAARRAEAPLQIGVVIIGSREP